jgi:hypothetical protein
VSGFQEIFVIIIIILAIFFVPRIMGKQQSVNRPLPGYRVKALVNLSGVMRLAIVASAVWPLIMAAMIKPWQGELFLFIFVGVCPVVFAWSAAWVAGGFKKKRR